MWISWQVSEQLGILSVVSRDSLRTWVQSLQSNVTWPPQSYGFRVLPWTMLAFVTGAFFFFFWFFIWSAFILDLLKNLFPAANFKSYKRAYLNLVNLNFALGKLLKQEYSNK